MIIHDHTRRQACAVPQPSPGPLIPGRPRSPGAAGGRRLAGTRRGGLAGFEKFVWGVSWKTRHLPDVAQQHRERERERERESRRPWRQRGTATRPLSLTGWACRRLRPWSPSVHLPRRSCRGRA